MEIKAINGSESFRDASFSYLRSDHRASARPSFSGDRKIKPPAGDSEISVFAAERYFNTPLHQARPDPTRSDLRSLGTPALLLSHRGGDADVAVSRRRRRPWMLVEGSRSFFATLGCACSGDKSASAAAASDGRHVDDDQQQNQKQDHRRHAALIRYEPRSTKRPEDHFAFPILSGGAAEPPRMSLEVFGSSSAAAAVDEVAANLERKLSVLTWDAIPAGGGSRVRTEDPDSDDASSDLFEIENITARVSGEGYEPSEASIEWSVVTASGCGGGGGDYDEKKISANTRRNTPPGKRMGMLGCKSHKSVRVAENNALTTKKP